MRAYTKGRDVLMAFEDDIGTALAKACELDNNKDAMHIAHAAQIVRRHIFGEAKPFNGFPEQCQEDCAKAVAYPCEHGPRGTQHQRPDGRSNLSCSTYDCSVAKIQQC